MKIQFYKNPPPGFIAFCGSQFSIYHLAYLFQLVEIVEVKHEIPSICVKFIHFFWMSVFTGFDPQTARFIMFYLWCLTEVRKPDGVVISVFLPWIWKYFIILVLHQGWDDQHQSESRFSWLTLNMVWADRVVWGPLLSEVPGRQNYVFITESIKWIILEKCGV